MRNKAHINFVQWSADDLKRNISQKTQQVLLSILDAAVIDADTAGPILTALVTTDAKAAENRYDEPAKSCVHT